MALVPFRPLATAALLAVFLGASVAATDPGVAVTGRAFLDADGDGTWDAGEEAFSGHRVYLFDAAGTFVATATTAADGVYRVDGLPTGTYTVAYDASAWSAIRGDLVPTTTGTVWPRRTVDATAAMDVDFGWRPITWSTDAGRPVSSYRGPSGLYVASYNDAVDARRIHDAVRAGDTGEEAGSVVIRFALSDTNTTTTTTQSSGGTNTAYSASVYVSYASWLDGHDATLAHEYGHAWSGYHAAMTQQDVSFAGYLDARGLTGDARLDTTYGWSVRELIAEDYRQLLGSATARSRPQANPDIPVAADVPGLESYLRDTFTRAPSTDGPPPPADEPPAEQPPAEDPDTTTTKKGKGGGAGGGGGRGGPKR